LDKEAKEMDMRIVENQDGTTTYQHSQGEVVYRQHRSGTYYHAAAPRQVVDALAAAASDGSKVRIHYGDPRTGKDWLEEFGVEGTLSRSMGPLRVPLIISGNSQWGEPLVDHCIVRLEVRPAARRAFEDVYRHPCYHVGKIEMAPSGLESHPYQVMVDGKPHANFATEQERGKFSRKMFGLDREDSPTQSQAAASALSLGR
jgi:hypothetical protein